MTGKAHPDDILVVGKWQEAAIWTEFPKSQVVTVSGLNLQLRGRTFRRAYVTDMALWDMDSRALAELDLARVKSGGEIVSAANWRPEPEPSIWRRLVRVVLP